MVDGKLINFDYPSISAEDWHRNYEAGIQRMADEEAKRISRIEAEKALRKRREAVQRKLCRRGKR